MLRFLVRPLPSPSSIHSRPRRRLFATSSSSSSSSSRDRLVQLEDAANRRPRDSFAQASLLRELTRAGHADVAVARHRSNLFATSGSARSAYEEAVATLRGNEQQYRSPMMETNSASLHSPESGNFNAFSLSNAPKDYRYAELRLADHELGTGLEGSAHAPHGDPGNPVYVKILAEKVSNATMFRRLFESLLGTLAVVGVVYFLMFVVVSLFVCRCEGCTMYSN